MSHVSICSRTPELIVNLKSYSNDRHLISIEWQYALNNDFKMKNLSLPSQVSFYLRIKMSRIPSL